MDPARRADTIRRWGYLHAALDPLERIPGFRHPDLEEALAGAADEPAAAALRAAYCGPIGAEFMHLPHPDRIRFLAERLEAPPPEPDRGALLRRLAEAELFERFLHQRYVGTKRYSLEGCAALIPLLDAILEAAAARGAEIALIGMAHRGRLNVMTRIVGVPPAHVFARFEDIEPRAVLGGGDVKYHLGATGTWRSAAGRSLFIHLVSNPSHLEAVDPVQMGRARARQERLGADGKARVVPITLHGDAAFAGQGIASETLNLSGLPGFRVGGTVHVIVNNLIGFTTAPSALHSSRFASDAAKRLDVPILHVNGEDPEAVARAGAIALEYRAAFGTDVVVDLIGYRRYGHSEVDDPTTTQPLLYRRIASLPMLWEAYAGRIGVGPSDRESLAAGVTARLESELEAGRAMTRRPPIRQAPDYWKPFLGGRADPALEVDTAIDAGRILEIARAITAVPDGFRVHPKVRKGLERRLRAAADGGPFDWGMAEALAFGSLLLDGVPVRLAGQDSRRGTFDQRHAVWVDVEDGREHVPLRHLGPGQARFGVFDTPLSEAAALGFEYGYSRDTPEALVLWEAQFGDFANGAQVIIDQFLVSGEDKWNLLSGLVLLLPHGYEGQGPEHSSARVERFLQLAGEDNIQVCQPGTAGQYFHLLRRQALRRWRKPLVVLTPKGLLRVAASFAGRDDLTAGRFRPVLGDPEVARGAARVLLCGGRIFHDLIQERRRRGETRTAILRLEQIQPFPADDLRRALEPHEGAREFVWVQEEPGNMGALPFVRRRIQAILGDRHLTSVKRSDSASPATGSPAAHRMEQEALLALAFARGDAGPAVS
jgi:2-oxoglutarate dehydrogenase E1 component